VKKIPCAHSDETGLSDSSSVDNICDSNGESHDEENDFDEINLEEDLDEFDAWNQLYVLAMIFSFMHGTNVAHIFLRREEGSKSIDQDIYCMLNKIKNIYHIMNQMDGHCRNFMICYIY